MNIARARSMRLVVIGSVMFTTACSSTTASEFGTSEAGADVAAAQCWQRDNVSNADGGGYCCPVGPWSVGGSGMCGDGTYAGGWVKTAGECCEQAGYADMPFTFATDSHGCTVVVPSATGCCPFCPGDLPDASDAAVQMDAADAADTSDAHD
jgi:hypothetical protein